MEANLEVIDLTQSFEFRRTSISLCDTVIELDDSVTFVPEVDESDSVLVNASRQRKERKPKISKKNKQARKSESEVKESTLRERSPIRESQFGNCPICFEAIGKNPLASTKCGHVFCLPCLKTSLQTLKKCPTCRKSLTGALAYHRLYLGQI